MPCQGGDQLDAAAGNGDAIIAGGLTKNVLSLTGAKLLDDGVGLGGTERDVALLFAVLRLGLLP